MKTVLGVNYFFGESEKNDGFVKADKPGPARFAHRFKEWMESRYDVEVHSWDYNLRRRAYAWFERHQPDQFDLYGQYWNAPVVCFERWFGYPHYENYRGELPNGGAGKVEKMAQYKFALCFENNASQPGYISEKITDCLCARCVPIYYGSRGIEKRIPRECFIDYRDFRSLAELEQFLVRMDERTYNRYLDAIERFLNSESAEYFTSDNFFRLIANGLGLSARVGSSN